MTCTTGKVISFLFDKGARARIEEFMLSQFSFWAEFIIVLYVAVL